MVKPKGDKQVEYLDLDLDSGKSTPPRKVSRCSALAGVQNCLQQDPLNGPFSNDYWEAVLDLSEEPVLVLHLFGTPGCFFAVNSLELISGCSQKKSSGSGSSVADERVDYVVVDQQKTLALKSTREAWTDGRQSTESETPTKSVKWKHCLASEEQKEEKFGESQNHTTALLFGSAAPDCPGWESVPHRIGWKPKDTLDLSKEL